MSEVLRECISDSIQINHWIIFDGPVDTFWIENLNSVLDDTKKLCLSNGQILSLNSNISIIFELTDLLNSTPANVSRCGIIYLSLDDINHMTIVEAWLKRLNPELVKSEDFDYTKLLYSLF